MKKAAIFDMDGTLVANSPIHIRAFEIFCARYGVTDWREKLANGFGMGNDDIMRLVMPEEVIREKGLAALADEKEAIYREIYAPDIRPVEGLKELLERLRAAGIPCAVGSSGCKANVDFVLDSCAIRPYFDAAISGDMVSRCKPDPEIYLTAAAALDSGETVLALRIASWDDVQALADYQYMLTKPVCFVCDDTQLLEAALRAYQGRALYDGDLPEDTLLPLCAKYGLLL